jgi:hypothetical protein
MRVVAALTGVLAILPEAAPAQTFDKSLSRSGVTFHVRNVASGSLGQVSVTTKGLGKPEAKVSHEVDGVVVGAETADLDRDGRPEILIFTQSAGSGSYGGVIGYAATATHHLALITMPDLKPDDPALKGYMGHDTFSVNGAVLERRFPVYAPNDPNALPSGGERILRYKLTKAKGVYTLTPAR